MPMHKGPDQHCLDVQDDLSLTSVQEQISHIPA